MKICIVSLGLCLVCSAASGSGPPLDQFGTRFTNADCEIVWKTPTNSLPPSVWVYRVLPSHFSASVISNLIALGEFAPNERVANLGPDARDLGAICYSNDKRSLGIHRELGFIEYRYPRAEAVRITEGVPTEDEIRTMGTNFLKMLEIDPSSVSPDIGVIDDTAHNYQRNPFRITTNTHARIIGFGRRLDGIDFYNKAESVEIKFAHHAVVRDLYLSWRNLERDNLYKTASPETIVKRMRGGECFAQVYGETELRLPDIGGFKRVTIIKATPYYYGEWMDKEQKWVYPFLYLETKVDMTEKGSVISMPPVGGSESAPANPQVRWVEKNLTNQTIFLCCPILGELIKQ